MSTVINTNLASLFAQNSLSNAQNNLATSVQRLSSGLRINSAKDDAAGLAISQNMQSQINGTNQSIQNLNNATNLLQTADSSLSTVQDMLLRMKQLAVQGYDGSLSNSQKADIVQQMAQLNSEINATATRTQFNGINLLSSGSTVDKTNSDLNSGSNLSITAVAVDTTQGLGSKVGIAGAGIGDAGFFVNSGGTTTNNGTATQVTIAIDQSKRNTVPGTYSLTSAGNQLTLTGTIDGVTASQSVTVGDLNGLNTANATTPLDQSLNFSNFGITINTHSVVSQGVMETGTNLARALATTGSLVVSGSTTQVQNMNINGAAAGAYQLSTTAAGAISTVSAAFAGTMISGYTLAGLTGGTYTVSLLDTASGSNATGATASVVVASTGSISSITLINGGQGYKVGDQLTIAAGSFGATTTGSVAIGSGVTAETGDALTMSGVVNGRTTTQTVELADAKASTTQNVNFDGFGISFDLYSYQAMTSHDIASRLTTLSSGSNGAAGQIVVTQGGNSDLQFQSGPSSSAFIDINTLNIQTGSSGQYAGTSNEMKGVGSSMDALSALVTAGTNASTAQWAAAFQTAAANVDTATDYVSTQRSTFGSQMNRLSYISTNLTAQSTNLQNSRSAIIDTNFASETASLTKGQIMQQAATAMLAQANQMPNVILSLLK